MLSRLAIFVAGPANPGVNYNGGINLDHMTRDQALPTLFVGIAILLICGALSANVKGISYTIVNGKEPDEPDHWVQLGLLRIVAGGFALFGVYMAYKSAAVLLG